MLEDWQHGGFGLYLHWPFCEAKCPYCDFNSHVSAHIDQDRWKRAYLTEIERAGSETEGRLLNSVFFGGGTPSLMDGELVQAVLDKIRETWTTANDLEVTLEANPSSVEAERFQSYADSGVNRVSLGIQALNARDLKALGRLHSVDAALAALETAKQQFDRVSFDLIYGRQDQSLKSWEEELTEALKLSGEHLSLYHLTIEPGTAFGARFSKGGLTGLPDEDLSADMFELTQSLCEDAGLNAYEVSNHAKVGAESRHNQVYWRCGDYVGIGPGAHGRLTLDGQRYATETSLAPMAWLLDVERKGSGESLRDALSVHDKLTEIIVMGLRLRDGIRQNRLLDSVFDRFWKNADDLTSSGLLKIEDGLVKITSTGLPILNSVTSALLRGY